MPMRSQVRSAALTGFWPAVSSLGGDPNALLAEFGLDRDAVEDPDRYISLRVLVDLLNGTAERLNCPDLGLRMASHHSPAMIGSLGQVMADSPNLGAALSKARQFAGLHNSSVAWHTEVRGTLLHVVQVSHLPDPEATRVYRELLTADTYTIFRSLSALPLPLREVQFSHERVGPLRPYQQFFGCGVSFGRDREQYVVDAEMLNYPVRKLSEGGVAPTWDSELRQRITGYKPDLEWEVRTCIAQGMHQQDLSLETVADMLGCHRRTLQRRLTAEGLTFRELATDVRMQAARWHLHASHAEISHIAWLLGYSDLAAFSKAFRHHYGVAPSHWRQARKITGTAP